MTRNAFWPGCVLACLGMLVSACGSSAPAPTPLSIASAGNAYIADIAPVDGASATFKVEASQWATSIPTNAEAYQEALPVIHAEQKFDAELAGTDWPAVAKADVASLIAENKTIITDLDELKTITLPDFPNWDATIHADTLADTAASASVRHDLGLPPPAA